MNGFTKRIIAAIMTITMFCGFILSSDLICFNVKASANSSLQSNYKIGDSFWFGHYPQERVNDQKLITALDQALKPVDSLLSNEQYYNYGNNAYCKINGIWYIISQIEWQIMDIEDKAVLLVSKKVLDYQQYNSSGKATTWEKCSLNKWLNTTFIEKAFSKTEKSFIKKNIIEGASNKIFILSYADAQNPKYGFSSDPTYNDPMRRTSGTDFAVDSGSGGGMCRWILREDGIASQFHYALDGENEGCIGECHGTVGISTYMGVRPAIRVNQTVESTGKETVFTTGKVYLDFQNRFFADDSKTYTHELARFCSQFVTIGYGKKFEINNALKSIGFENIEIENSTGRNQVNYFIAQRKVFPSGNYNSSYTLIFIGLIGSHHDQWYSNFDPEGHDIKSGVTDCPKTVHRGFWDAKVFAHKNLEKYINSLSKKNPEILSNGKVKLLIAGHSRGAAASNLLAADIIDANGINIGKYSECSKNFCRISNDNVYTYAFATPNSSAQKENGSYIRNRDCYKRIFNIVNPEDFVTKVMPTSSGWGFGNFGTTYSIPSKSTYDPGSYNKILNKMQVYYKQMTEGAEYHPYKNGINDVDKIISTFTKYIDFVGETDDKEFVGETDDKDVTYGGFYDNVDKFKRDMNISPFEFFKYVLCPFVAKAPAKVCAGALGSILGIISSPNSHTLYKDFIYFFLSKEALGMLANKIIPNNNVLNEYFADAHTAETYCAFMMAMSSAEIKADKKPKKYSSKCPVDIEIYYKLTGELVGRIINNIVDEEVAAKDNAVTIFVDGDEKVFYLPNEQDYEVKIIGNDNGTMDFSVSTIDDNEGEVERTNYYDVEIKDGASLVYNQADSGEVSLTDENNDVVNVDEILTNDNFNAININISTEGIGNAGEYLSATKGDYISLNAETDINNSFLGWYENDVLVSTECNYSFVAKQDRNLVAKFTNVFVDVTEIGLLEDSVTLNRFGENCYALMHCSVSPSNATNQSVVWSSSDETVATVDESGLVVSVSPGTAVITATTVDGKYTASCIVTVKNNLGDVNDDGRINSSDALQVLQISVEQIETNDEMLEAADVCKDTSINSIDALMILMYSVGDITSFE